MQSGQTATDPQINGTHRDVMARRQRTRRAKLKRMSSVRFLASVKLTDFPWRGGIGCTDGDTAEHVSRTCTSGVGSTKDATLSGDRPKRSSASDPVSCGSANILWPAVYEGNFTHIYIHIYIYIYGWEGGEGDPAAPAPKLALCFKQKTKEPTGSEGGCRTPEPG